MNIVRYECGCIGIPNAADGTAAILVACDSEDRPGPGRPDRPMGDKKYEPIDFTQRVYQAFCAESKLYYLQRAISTVVSAVDA